MLALARWSGLLAFLSSPATTPRKAEGKRTSFVCTHATCRRRHPRCLRIPSKCNNSCNSVALLMPPRRPPTADGVCHRSGSPHILAPSQTLDRIQSSSVLASRRRETLPCTQVPSPSPWDSKYRMAQCFDSAPSQSRDIAPVSRPMDARRVECFRSPKYDYRCHRCCKPAPLPSGFAAGRLDGAFIIRELQCQSRGGKVLRWCRCPPPVSGSPLLLCCCLRSASGSL